ncbi:dCTP deaminase domain-containing protein [Psychrobacter alimentarius]|uniref:dCTP deaminase domain-containing protein n=1 Tax=Psychrobacter alimentarius TaxID=261164 RepID=UPI003FD0512F
MSFWSTQEIIRRNQKLSRIDNTKPLISGFKEDRVKEASYTLTVGSEAFITSSPQTKLDEVKKLDISDGFCYIPPGQFAYLITEEEVNIPTDCLAFISMKFSTKASGLVNVSGFHVDPGYSGKLIFAVYNAGVNRIPIRMGMEIFLIWFSSLEAKDDKPKIGKKGFDKIPSTILENSQDAETLQNLSEKISELESQLNQSSFKSTITLGLLIPVNIFLLKILNDEVVINEVPWFFWLIPLIILFVLLFHIDIHLYFRKKKKAREEKAKAKEEKAKAKEEKAKQ